MSKSHFQLTRKCTVCGQTKPLAAFAQQGNTYSTICATCREQQKAEADSDSTTPKERYRLDNEAKSFLENEQKAKAKQTEQLHKEILEKKDKINIEKETKKEKTAGLERKHRETYLGIGKQNAQEKKAAADLKGEQAVANAGINEKASITQRQLSQEAGVQKEKAEFQERITSTIDYSVTVPQSQFSMIKFNNPQREQIKRAFFGKASPMMQNTLEQIIHPAEKTAAAETPAKEPQKPVSQFYATTPTQKPTPVSTEAEKNWGRPTPRK